MHTPPQETQRRHSTGKRKSLLRVPPSAALPRKIAPGVFFVNPSGDSKDEKNLPSIKTLIDLEITHAVLARGSNFQLLRGMKALFVGPHDPLAKVVAWMHAVRGLGAHIIVGDVAAAAGYLVVEFGLTPRAAWLRIAHGIPPSGDLLLARLYALALVQTEKGKENGPVYLSKKWGGYEARGIQPRPCQSQRCRTRAESGLKHVLISI
jgi:hypothetical protein